MRRRALIFSLGLTMLAAASLQASAAETKKLILVTGATGNQGGALITHLLERGYAVRGLTRDPEQPDARSLAQRGVEIVKGDFADSQSIERAATGAHGMFLNTPNTASDEAGMGAAAIDAAKRVGVRHIVYSTYYHGHPEKGLPHAPKARVEQHLRRSGVAYTILRPCTFMDNIVPMKEKLISEGLREALPADFKQQFIAAHDIGFFAAEAFSHPEEWSGRELEIAGDELTPPEVAQLYSDILDRPIEYRKITWEETGIPERFLESLRWWATGVVRADVAALRARYPNLFTYRQFLEQHWGRRQTAEEAHRAR